MKKNLTVSGLFCAFLIAIISIVSCNKKDSSKDLTLNASKPKTDKLAGPCPYNCQDSRCQFYTSGYCGSPTPPPPALDTINVITNPNNSYESIGVDHNNAVNYFMQQINASTPQSYAFIQKENNIYLNKIGFDTVQNNNIITAAVADGYYSKSDTGFLSDPTTLLTKLYNNRAIDSYTQTYLQNIFTYFNTDISDTAAVTQAIYTKFANDVITVENAASNDTRLTSQEKQYILAAGTTARHSMAFWTNYILKSQSSGGAVNIVINISNKTAKHLKVAPKHSPGKTIAIADVAGAVGGAVTAGVASAVLTGGIGTPAGIVAGGIGGGVGGSCAAAVVELLNWAWGNS